MSNYFLFFVIITFFALYSWRRKSLSLSGAISAIVVGMAIFIGLNWQGLILLGIFFVTSTYFSKIGRAHKRTVEDIVAKGDRRDWLQVFANGGVPAICSLLFFQTGESIWLIAFCSALAASNADTWASEIGVLSKQPPVLIFTLEKVPKGTSGAVSLFGTAAGFFGALTIGVAAKVLWFHSFSVWTIILITFLGFFGMVLDTCLGYFLQIKYQCPVCQMITEKKEHCGVKTSFLKGLPFLNNDGVNFLSAWISSMIPVIFYAT